MTQCQMASSRSAHRHDSMKTSKGKSKALATRTKSSEVDEIYRSIAEILETARANAYRAVNQVMVQAYWQIGRVIVEEE